MRFSNNFSLPEINVVSKKSLWVKKRHSETARAKAQQRHRRKRGLFKKAAEFCLECKSDVFVAVRVRKTGQMYMLDSSSRSQWLNIMSNLVYPIKSFSHHPAYINRHRTTLIQSKRQWRISSPNLASICQIGKAHQLLPDMKRHDKT